MNKVYIIDYDSVTYVCGGVGIGLNSKHVQEINRQKKTALFSSKTQLLEGLAHLSNDECVENIKVSVNVLQRDYIDINGLLNKE